MPYMDLQEMLNNDMVQGGHIRIHLIISQQDVRVA